MNLLKNNLTFAILPIDSTWRLDLTTCFCEYFSFGINGDDFMERIELHDSVDAALLSCKTDYLLVQQEGHVPFNSEFFSILELCAAENSDMVLGNIILKNDWATLDKSCLFFNMKLWTATGNPPYRGKLKHGPLFTSSGGSDRYHPAQLKWDGEKLTYLPIECSYEGAELLIKQLELFKVATSLPAVSAPENYFFIDCSLPYYEIKTETMFEKKYLEPNNQIIHLSSPPQILPQATFSTVVAPAIGMRPLELAEHYHATRIIIYSNSQAALDFQKMMFSFQEPVLYGEMVDQIRPNITVRGAQKEDRNRVIKPFKAKVEFQLIDPFSYQMEELVASIGYEDSAVFDLADIYISPYNYYRRSSSTVWGLFVELFSKIKARSGQSLLLGFGPGFRSADDFYYKAKWDKFYEEFLLLGTVPQEPELHLEAEHCIVPIERTPIPVFSKSVKEEVESIVEHFAQGRDGYSVEMICVSWNGKSTPVIQLTQVVEFPELDAIYEYTIDPTTAVWTFKVGKIGHKRKVEYANGHTAEGLLKHLNVSEKINSATAIKYFK